MGENMRKTCFDINSMNNLLSYCGIVDAKIRASDIDLPATEKFFSTVKNDLDCQINLIENSPSFFNVSYS